LSKVSKGKRERPRVPLPFFLAKKNFGETVSVKREK